VGRGWGHTEPALAPKLGPNQTGTLIDDHSRVCLASTARRVIPSPQVWAIFATAIGRWGPPAEVLTDIQTWWRPLGPWIVRPAV
jgi:hypothetical protein